MSLPEAVNEAVDYAINTTVTQPDKKNATQGCVAKVNQKFIRTSGEVSKHGCLRTKELSLALTVVLGSEAVCSV